MKVQIYEHTTPEDAAMSANTGVDFIGVVTGERNRLAHEVDFATCRAIFAAIPAQVGAWRVALTVAWELPEIVETVQAVQPEVIHLSGGLEDLPPAQVGVLRAQIPPIKLMQAIPVRGPESIDLALAYQPVADYLLLDSAPPNATEIGATGATHDWGISAEIVRRVKIPVILAGGLSPANVAQAIQVVKPWGVDSYTHTNQPDSRRKDPSKVKAFLQAARTSQASA